MSTVVGDGFLGKVPPHSSEAELSVIGGVLLHNAALDVVCDILRPDDFYTEAHELIFGGIVALYNDSRPVDLIHLGEHLKDRGELESVGGLSYLASILDNVPTAANIEAHARLVAEKASVRSCIGAAMGVVDRGYGDYGDARVFLDESEASIFEATRDRTRPNVQRVGSAMSDSLKDIERLQKLKSEITGVPTGYPALDRLTTGLQPSDLVILAARPAMGKTALALNIAANVVRETDVGVVIFSLEMAINQLMQRLLSSESKVPLSTMRVPRRITEADLNHLIDAADRLHSAPIFIDDSAEVNALEIRSRSRRLRRKENIGLIIIDYLQIMRPVQRSKGETGREREIAETTRSLKALAKELPVPVICLSQLNRSPELRSDKRPQLSDLRESGAIEQDADLVLFLYREAMYQQGSDDPTTEVIVGKNRNGPTGLVKLAFVGEQVRFENLHDGEESRDRADYGNMRIGLEGPPDEDDSGAPF